MMLAMRQGMEVWPSHVDEIAVQPEMTPAGMPTQGREHDAARDERRMIRNVIEGLHRNAGSEHREQTEDSGHQHQFGRVMVTFETAAETVKGEKKERHRISAARSTPPTSSLISSTFLSVNGMAPGADHTSSAADSWRIRAGSAVIPHLIAISFRC